MAVTNTTTAVPTPPTMTVALLPGKPETRMRLADLQRKERQEQKEQDKKLDNNQKQLQSSTVVKISARAKELNRTEPVERTSSAVKADNPTGQATKEKEASRAAPVPQPPLAANTGSPAAPAPAPASATPEKRA